MKKKLKETIFQFLRYGISGGLSFVVYFVLLFLFTEYGHLYHLTSLVAAYALSACVNFAVNRFFVFKSKNKKIWKEMISFGGVALFGMLLQAEIVWLCTEIFHWNYLWANVLASGVVYGVSFILNKILTFKNAN